MKLGGIDLKKIVFIILILLLLISCQKTKKINNENNELSNVQSKTITDNNIDREFKISTKINSEYEQVIVDELRIDINGNFDQLNKLTYEKISPGVISNSEESFSNGYGAKEISIDYIKTYENIEDLYQDEKNIPYGLEETYAEHEKSKIIFIIYNYTNTEKSMSDHVMYNNNGAVSQYYIVSEIEDKLLVTYAEFTGN
jgi:hypothetical protein